MVYLNQETGFYAGEIYTANGGTYIGDCVPVAVANYMVINRCKEKNIYDLNDVANTDIYRTDIENFLQAYTSTPDYVDGGKEVLEHIKTLQDCLRQYVSKNTVFLACHVKTTKNSMHFVEKEENSILNQHAIRASNPAVVFSSIGDDLSHAWVAVKTNGGQKQVDNDGFIYKYDGNILGYFDIDLDGKKQKTNYFGKKVVDFFSNLFSDHRLSFY